MKCEYCDQRNPEGLTECQYCGAPLAEKKRSASSGGGYYNDASSAILAIGLIIFVSFIFALIFVSVLI